MSKETSHDGKSSSECPCIDACNESDGKQDLATITSTTAASRHPQEDRTSCPTRAEADKETISPPEKKTTTTKSARILSSSHNSLILLPLFDENKSVSTPALNIDYRESILFPTLSEQELQLTDLPANDMEPAAGENRNLLLGTKKLTYESTHRRVRRPKLRRAVSESSSFPDARIGRTRKLYCPRQPPTNLQRTLSISRSSIPIFKKTTGKRLTSKQKQVLICISLVSFFSFLSMAIIAPFFPNEAAKKNMSGTLSGLVFSCYALVVMLVSPILGTFLPVIGAKFMLIAGVFVAGVANILFGLLNYIESSEQFAIFCFLVRTFEALGAAAFSTASYTYIMNDFPDDIGTAFGFTETCMGLGMSLGPAVGAGLYTLGGYGLPFYVLGTMILLNIPLCWLLVEPIDMIASLKESEPQSSPDRSDNTNRVDETVVKRKRKSNYLTLVVIPEVAAVSVVVAVVSQSSGFLDPTLEPHFRQYELGTNVVGFVFLAMSLAYAILAPIVGWIASKMDNTFPLMILGLLVSAAGLVLLGPAWFLPLDPTVWLSFLAVVLMGFAHAIAFIPTFEAILDIALEKGFPDNVRTYSLVSGLWSSVYSLGEVTGPTFGGLFVDLYDFSNGCTIAAGFSLAAALITTITYIISRRRSAEESESESESEDSSDEDDERQEHDMTPSKCAILPVMAPIEHEAEITDSECTVAIAIPHANGTSSGEVERELAGTI